MEPDVEDDELELDAPDEDAAPDEPLVEPDDEPDDVASDFEPDVEADFEPDFERESVR